MVSNVKTRLAEIGRLDLLSGLGTEVRSYYDALEKIPGGMRGDDVDRMAQASDMIGNAELKAGKPEAAYKTWSEARGLLAASLEQAASHDSHERRDAAHTRGRRRMIALLDQELGGVYYQRGKIADAISSYTTAKHEYDALREEDPSDREVLLGAADTHDKLGDLDRTEGKLDDAYDEYAEARREREQSSGQGNGRPSEEVLALSVSHVKLGSIHQARGESQAALDEYKAALRLRDTLLESEPDNVEILEKLLELKDTMADLERTLGDDAGAIAMYREAVPQMDALVLRDATNTTWKRQRGNLLADLGFALIDSGAFKDGLDQLSAAIDTQQELTGRDPDNAPWAIDLSRTYTRAGDAHLDLGESDAAIAQYDLARVIRDKLVDHDPASVPYRRSLAWALAKLAHAYAQKGEPAKAIDSDERALEMRQKLAEEAPTQGGFKNELAASEINLGRRIAAKDPARAGQLVDAGVERTRQLVTADNINLEWKETLVTGLLAQSELQHDAKARQPLLLEAQHVAEAATQRAPQNVHWVGFLGEIHVARAEAATALHDAATASAEWKAARDVLGPAAKDGRLPAPRRPLLDRARAAR
jgi:tetratricopeptide (TPR) repeat protein